MARDFSSRTLELLASGHVEFRYLVSVERETDPFYVGTHTPGEIISWDSQSWYGVGGLITIPDLTTSTGTAADQITLTVNGSALTAPPPGYDSVNSVLRGYLQSDLINARCEITELIIDPDTGEPSDGISVFAGAIDHAPLNLDRSRLSVRVRSNRQALGWDNARTRSDADQRRHSANDGSLRFVSDEAARGAKVAWGYQPKTGTRSNGGGGYGGGGGSRGGYGANINLR